MNFWENACYTLDPGPDATRRKVVERLERFGDVGEERTINRLLQYNMIKVTFKECTKHRDSVEEEEIHFFWGWGGRGLYTQDVTSELSL